MPTFMFPGATSAEAFAAAVDEVESDHRCDYVSHEYRPNVDGVVSVLVVVGKRRPGRPKKIETR